MDKYKKCYSKSYEIYACIPQKGTLFFDKLQHPDLYLKIGKKDIFTVQECTEKDLYNKYQGYIQTNQMFVADERTILACGVLSELYRLGVYDLLQNFVFADDSPMNVGALNNG